MSTSISSTGGATIADPVGQRLADAARGEDADGVEARRAEEARHFGRLAEKVAVVGGEALRAVEEQLDAGALQHRHAARRLFQIGGDVIDIFRQRAETEVLGNTRLTPRLGIRLEEADQQLAGILLVVCPFVAEEEHRQVARQILHLFGDDVEMLGGVQGDGHARFGGEVARPHAAADDHGPGADRPPIGHHAGGLAVLDEDLRDGKVLEDLCAAHARALGIGLRHVDRVDLPVMREPEAADNAVCADRPPALLDLPGRDRFDRQAEIAAHRGAARQLLIAGGRVGDAQRTVALEAGRLAGLGLERAEELPGIFGKFRHASRGAQLRHETGRMPCRAARELLSFAHHHIRYADPGQVIGNRAPRDAAADNDDVCSLRNISHCVSPSSGAIRCVFGFFNTLS